MGHRGGLGDGGGYGRKAAVGHGDGGGSEGGGENLWQPDGIREEADTQDLVRFFRLWNIYPESFVGVAVKTSHPYKCICRGGF